MRKFSVRIASSSDRLLRVNTPLTEIFRFFLIFRTDRGGVDLPALVANCALQQKYCIAGNCVAWIARKMLGGRSIDMALLRMDKRESGSEGRKRVLAVASGGGHWEQLMLLRDAFSEHDVVYVTTMRGLGERAGLPHVRIVSDCNRNRPIQAAWCAVQLAALICWHRPHIVISTGALPGIVALAIGRKLGSRNIWIDSIANAEEFSMAGRQARSQAHLWMSQWSSVAAHSGAEYAGSVL